MKNVYYSIDFTGYGKSNTSIVCFADNEIEAREFFENALIDFKLTFDGTIQMMPEGSDVLILDLGSDL